MKKLKITIQLFIFFILVLLCSKVNAASITLAPSKSSVNIGDQFTVSMNLSGASLASLNVKVIVDTSKVEYVSSNAPSNTNYNNGKILYTWTDTSGGSNPKGEGTIAVFTLKTKKAGTASFSVSGNFYDVNENPVNMSLGSASVTIIDNTPVTPPEEPPQNNPTTPENPPSEQPNIPPENNENNNDNNNNNNNNNNGRSNRNTT